MRKITFVLITVLLVACNGDNVPDCFQNAGDIIVKEFQVEPFTKISTFPKIELIVTDAPTQSVVVQTGEYLLDEIEVRVIQGRLELRNNNTCNLVRDYGLTKVFVSAPNLEEIRNGSAFPVRSQGILSYERLDLISENFTNDDAYNSDGDFILEVNSNIINTNINNLSNCFISGTVNELFLGFYSGNARFEGRNLIAQNVRIYQRSTNDLVVNPQNSLSGQIRSTGDVIVVNMPPTIEVEQFYTGQLIFE